MSAQCDCPFLAACAEMARTAEVGVTPFADALVVSVALLRDRHGCPGPDRSLICPWHQYGTAAEWLTTRRKPKPLYRGEDPPAEDKGQYL